MQKEDEKDIAKDIKNKPRLGLVSPYLIEAVGKVRTYGSEKYGNTETWRTVPAEYYRDAMMRHLVAYMKDPQAIDAESGLPHLWHLACNVNFLIELAETSEEVNQGEQCINIQKEEETKTKEFTKNDLQVNDIVTVRDGERYMIYKIKGDLIGVSSNDCFYVGKGAACWDDDMIHHSAYSLDMMKVQRPVYPHQLQTRSWDTAPVIWERKEVSLLSEAEYHILKNLSTQWKSIARDEEGELLLYDEKPGKYNGRWRLRSNNTALDIYNHLFPFVKWEDDEAWEIAKLLERYEENHNAN